MITREQYEAAYEAKKQAEETINQFFKEKAERFNERMESNPIFSDEELVYSATSLCPCGHGLAYPKDCTPFHYWDCSAILRGTADESVTHEGRLPFTFYDIKSESAYRGTTRGVFKPKVPASA